MGIKSTYQISKEVAIQVLISSIYKCTDTELEDMLEALKESKFRNYRIDNNPSDDWNKISTVNDFFNEY